MKKTLIVFTITLISLFPSCTVPEPEPETGWCYYCNRDEVILVHDEMDGEEIECCEDCQEKIGKCAVCGDIDIVEDVDWNGTIEKFCTSCASNDPDYIKVYRKYTGMSVWDADTEARAEGYTTEYVDESNVLYTIDELRSRFYDGYYVDITGVYKLDKDNQHIRFAISIDAGKSDDALIYN